MSVDFKALEAELLSRSPNILFEFFPQGRIKGNRFVVGSVNGEPGDSLSIDIKTGVFADFADESVRGVGIIKLYSFIHRIGQVEAAKALGAKDDSPKPGTPVRAELLIPEKVQDENIPAPEDAPPCRGLLAGEPEPSGIWAYRTPDGKGVYGYDIRYDYPDKRANGKNKKAVKPWRWDHAKEKWICKGFAAPSPLMGLDDLTARPTAKVFLVEGAKKVEAGLKMIPQAVWVTWQGGVGGWTKADFSPLYGREVFIWPDADAVGIKAMLGIGNRLLRHCPIIHYLDPTGMPEGWDVADAVAEGWDFKKWQQWALTRKREIKEKVIEEAQKKPEGPPNVPPPKEALPHERLWIDWGLVRSESTGLVISNEDNVCRIFENDPTFKDYVYYDSFLCRMISRGQPWTDVDEINVMLYLQRVLAIRKIAKETVRNAILSIAMRNKRHAVQDWLKSLPVWDRVPRLATLFSDHFGAPQSEYSSAVGRCFIVSLVARAMIPGCKADNVVILEGKQGIRKSTALEAIVGKEWFATAHHEVTDKDFLQAFRGKWMIEIAELDSFQRSELEAVKSMVSRPFDTYRVSYGHYAEDWKRQVIFAATTNKDNWNLDETGARRFQPLRTTEIDIAAIRKAREQLFAEGLYLFNLVPLDADETQRTAAGADWWMTPKEMTQKEQDDRYEEDPWTEVVVEYLGIKRSISATELLTNAVKLDLNKQDVKEQRRIGRILRRLGWIRGTERAGNSTRKVWMLPETSANDF